MASRLIYLEVDDEITSAAARIRGSDQERLAVVLPYGSRVATSRINFRLLARDATEHDKRLSIVSADSATRALAASAGLPVFASVAEYEAADADGAAAGAAGVAGGATGAAVAGAAAAGVRTEPPSPAPDGTLGLVPGVGAAAVVSDAGETVRAPIPREMTRAPEPRPSTTPGHDDSHRRRWSPHPHALAHRWGDPRPCAPRRWRRCVRPSAIGHHRRHPATRADHAAAPDGRR